MRIRDEEAFESKESLVGQIRKDEEDAKRIFKARTEQEKSRENTSYTLLFGTCAQHDPCVHPLVHY